MLRRPGYEGLAARSDGEPRVSCYTNRREGLSPEIGDSPGRKNKGRKPRSKRQEHEPKRSRGG
jgi:hypothetical protein